MGHTLKYGSRLAKWVTLGKIGHTLHKINQIFKNGSNKKNESQFKKGRHLKK